MLLSNDRTVFFPSAKKDNHILVLLSNDRTVFFPPAKKDIDLCELLINDLTHQKDIGPFF